MREIKFRAWDGIKMRGIGNLQDRFSIRNDGVVNGNIEYILMQYTGLKDKNGTEIYEGDILQRNDNSIAVVEFENGMFITKYDALMWELCENSPIVIGNIYQNPELLG